MPKPPQTLLGFDFGLKHIGVAVGQVITATANPLTVVRASNGQADFSAIKKLIKEWQPDGMVVGIPINMDGTDNRITKAARRFADELRVKFNLPIWQIDERLTTVDAKEALFASGGYQALDKGSVDSYAAKLILESWLREETNNETHE